VIRLECKGSVLLKFLGRLEGSKNNLGIIKSRFFAPSWLCSGRTTLKKRCVDKLVLGCFLGLAFAASAGCGLKRSKKV
jgi:hypothetical protein